MKIEKTSHGPWTDCYKCTLPERTGAGEVELIIVAQIGPRIISLRVNGGPNLLFDDSAGRCKRGDWNSWGGHRFWASPETETTYYLDTAQCEVRQSGESIRVIAPVEMPSGLQKALEISECPVSGGFRVRHILTNTGAMLAPAGIWGITCVLPQGRIIVPWGEGSPRTADPASSWRTHMVRYWRQWGGSTTDIESRQWHAGNDYFMVTPTGETGKVGLYSDLGAVALLRADATFVKFSPPRSSGFTYPDGGCNIEMFTCDAFVEMETLGPIIMLTHGESSTHDESWVATAKMFEPGDWQAVAELTRRH